MSGSGTYPTSAQPEPLPEAFAEEVIDTTSLAADVDALLQIAQASDRGFETGRTIISFRPGEHASALDSLRAASGVQLAAASDFTASAVNFSQLGDADYLVLERLGVAIGAATPRHAPGALLTAALSPASGIAAIEPETFAFACGEDILWYLRGFHAATTAIMQGLPATLGPAPAPVTQVAEPAVTWGLQAVGAADATLTGKGIKVAVLDTGLDFGHPDFRGRAIVSQSFITGQTASDGHGHGTHTAGTACGIKAPTGVPRYGIASDAALFIGKVLSNSGAGTSASILAGINWAITNQCAIISMSLAGPGGPFAYYTQAGEAALDAGCLIIAAAGNDSRRPAYIAPSAAPANSPSILAVGAVDQTFSVAPFSNALPASTSLVGPGVDVFSSVPMPQRYGTKSGTSMATPHVAGCAALLAQGSPGDRGRALWTKLMANARKLPGDTGGGLVKV